MLLKGWRPAQIIIAQVLNLEDSPKAALRVNDLLPMHVLRRHTRRFECTQVILLKPSNSTLNCTTVLWKTCWAHFSPCLYGGLEKAANLLFALSARRPRYQPTSTRCLCFILKWCAFLNEFGKRHESIDSWSLLPRKVKKQPIAYVRVVSISSLAEAQENISCSYLSPAVIHI